MKTRPILFSGPMVRAIVEGRKTQTRRIVRLREGDLRAGRTGEVFAGDEVRSPYGVAGDQLWVRETWGTITGNGIRTVYRADGEQPMGLDGKMVWNPSIFMRPAQSRIQLEVVSVRAEKLQGITELEAKLEGVVPLEGVGPDQAIIERTPETCRHFGTHPYTGAYAVLWDTINGQRASWSSNPWVWAVTFKVLMVKGTP